MKINPEDYDYLWSDYDIDFIFVSCYLSKDFCKNDIVLIYKHENKELRFFLSKKDRAKLSRYAITHYKKNFDSWKKNIEQNISLGKKLINSRNDDILFGFQERVELFQGLINDYFFTEFFFMDEIEKSKDETINKNLKEMGRLKFEARAVLNQFYNHSMVFGNYVKRLSRMTKRNDLRWLSYDEIIKAAKGHKVRASRRDKMDWILAKKTDWKILSGKNSKKIIEDFDNSLLPRKIDEFGGIIASKGYYKGRVKLIKTIFSDNIKKEILKFKKGEVLVAQTTGPELMHILQKAGAIITDEGGMMSHAAIVSREFGIPCIVGARIATRVLKDNDIVEVDANSGIVRILTTQKR